MLCDYVLEGMKCGITDMSAGSSDMADSLRIWFTYRGSIGIGDREPRVVWPAGEDGAPRWSADLQSELLESKHLLRSPTTYMRQL